MLLHPTIPRLEQMRLGGMAAALRDQMAMPDIDRMPFMDRLGLMVEHEAAVREDRRLTRRLRQAKLGLQACMPDLDYGQRRGLDRRVTLHLSSCMWVRRRQNVLITGPTGVGKTYVACALAHKACLENFRVRYHRLPRLLEELQTAREEGRRLRLLKQLARTDVLVLDDWGLHSIEPVQQRNLMELIEDRYNLKSTLVTSQYPVEKWHDAMSDPTLADAILDRIVHNVHRISLSGESMRKVLGQQDIANQTTE